MSLNLTSIIVLTDFSEVARNATLYAIHAFGENVEYHLVNSYYIRSTSTTLLDLSDVLSQESKKKLSEEIDWIKTALPDLELNITSHSVFGTPPDAIQSLLEKRKYDLIVMGTKGASGLDAVLFGSVAASIMQSSLIPVISVPPLFSFSGYDEIVFATDGQEITDEETLTPLNTLLNHFNANLTVLSVKDNDSTEETTRFDFESKKVHYINIVEKDIAQGITDYCLDKKADLLVVIPKHTKFFNRLFHKSISKKLVQDAHLPMLSL